MLLEAAKNGGGTDTESLVRGMTGMKFSGVAGDIYLDISRQLILSRFKRRRQTLRCCAQRDLKRCPLIRRSKIGFGMRQKRSITAQDRCFCYVPGNKSEQVFPAGLWIRINHDNLDEDF